MGGKHKAKVVRKRAAKGPQKIKRARVIGIGDPVHVRGHRKIKGTILGWDLRNPHKVIYYVIERKP